MSPKVSIVFTSYNHKEFLAKSVESLLAQTFTNFELIIVDDCSTDGSQELLRSYTDPRIRLFLRESNFGTYVKSTNYGASLATGDYLLFAQCDDYAEPTQLDKLVTAIEQYKVGVVFSKSRMIDQNDLDMGIDFEHRSVEFKNYCTNSVLIPSAQMMKFLFQSCVIPNLSAALLKRQLFIEIGGLSDKYLVLADWNMWLQLTQKSDFYFVSEPLNNFRQHGTTIRNLVKLEKQINELFYMFSSFKTIKKLDKPTQAYLTNCVYHIFNWYINEFKNLSTTNYISLIILATKYDPKLGWLIIKNINKRVW